MELCRGSYGVVQPCNVCPKIQAHWDRGLQSFIREMDFQSMWWLTSRAGTDIRKLMVRFTICYAYNVIVDQRCQNASAYPKNTTIY